MSLRQVGLIGDVHGEDEALAMALAELERLGADRILCVGDVPDGLGDVDRCCALLEGADVVCVAGNHERWLLADQMRDLADATRLGTLTDQSARYLEALPASRELDTVAGRALLCHGLGDDDMAALKADDFGYAIEANDALQRLVGEGRYRFVLNGHTHQRMVRRVGALTVIGAGTLYREHDPCFALVDFEQLSVRYFDIRGGVVRAEDARPIP